MCPTTPVDQPTLLFVIVVYDIPNDRRRQKLHDALLNFGTPVQYSVFEITIEPGRLPELKKAVQKVIRKKLDHVRYYYLCGKCVRKTETTMGDIFPRPGAAVVV
ncbi:MAG: CRISPR-associated endonuclease Cas2 [Anaerolineae bacterium]|jgi:CRISPR-associated protein Cas2|nr:CRISPR-associated endonuclease Cas2 [Anaerolineae bacterium]